jgi:subtilisin family serine protease
MAKEKVMSKFILFIIIFLQLACGSNKQLVINDGNNLKQLKLSKTELKSWHHKDIIKDSIPGISLDRVYQELIKNKKGNEVIVAVIDTQVDLNHKDLKNAFWINKDEIPNNNIDDDNNGYIDDINGWNFIGNKKGESVFDSNFEYVRVVRKYKDQFEDSTKVLNSDNYKIYYRALNKLKYEIKYNLEDRVFYKKWKIRLSEIKKSLDDYFPKRNYTLKKLQSIKTENKILKDNINEMIYNVKNGYLDNWLINKERSMDRYEKYFLNIDYNDRELIGDNPKDINDKYYGYRNVGIAQSQLIYHSTYVTGILIADRNNNIGLKGISDNIRVLPISISSNGDEYDKDIALAIKYAVDNGAQIINMSSSKEFSINQDWVNEALKYAENYNVLFVTSAANSGYDVDKNIVFPNDFDDEAREMLDNFICVGASTIDVNKRLIASFSNFGKKNVDLFAPGKDIYTTEINNQYKYIDGTSMATPIVSGVAALIWSYYPNLKASEVKEILLESGVSYDIDVEIRGEDGKKKLVPFSSLSKSGKIVNAYNALLYAKNYIKWKQGK